MHSLENELILYTLENEHQIAGPGDSGPRAASAPSAGGGLFGQQPAYGQPQLMGAARATQPATRFEQLPATPATLGRDGVLAVEKHLAQNRTLQKRVALAAQPVREGMAHLREADLLSS